ncbi:transposase [Micromonospora sp. NPDC050276]|uniref:transposase n=1 Tax=Micromonospora sp. NPDC050276 TaxID=3364278 RepID=UPI0037AD5FCE
MIEGCQGIGRHIANRLLADGEQVLDVPSKLSARARVFATGQGRKTDATDAHSIALVGTRMAGLRPVVNDEQLALLRILVDRRRSLGEDHTRMVSQLHQLPLELIPGGAKKSLSAAQAKALLAKVRPRDAVGKARRRVAAELISDLERIYQHSKEADKELKELVASTGTTLMDPHGVGPSGAARLPVEVGGITRFPNRAHFSSWNGTAPIAASSGEQIRHQLSRAGNRQIMATVQLGNPTEGRAYFDRKKAAGKTSMEAMRALKRRLSDIVYRQINDATTATATGPGGQRETTTGSSVTGSHPQAGSSEKSLPGPAETQLRTPLPTLSSLTQRGAMSGRPPYPSTGGASADAFGPPKRFPAKKPLLLRTPGHRSQPLDRLRPAGPKLPDSLQQVRRIG